MLIPVLSAAIFLAAIYHLVIFPLLVSPLRSVPAAHPLARFTQLWILWIRYVERENRTVHAAHIKHGPIVLLSPREISVNCVDGGIRSVYAGNFEKDEWYAFFANFGAHNMFSKVPHGPHSVRKRMLSHVYSKSYIQASPSMAAIATVLIYERLLPLIRRKVGSRTPVNVYSLFNAYTLDSITAYVFGIRSSTNHLQEPDLHDSWLDTYWSRFPYRYWEQEVPNFTRWMSKVGIKMVPRDVNEANGNIEGWISKMCDKSLDVVKQLDRNEEVKAEDVPTVYRKLRSELEKGRQGSYSSEEKLIQEPTSVEPLSLEIASEVWDHVAAGFDTSGIFLTYAAWELSRNPHIQARLRTELLSLSPPINLDSQPSLPRPQEMDALPLLHAVVMETLRLHSSIPGAQPRNTPYPSCTLGEYKGIPGGLRVNAQAYSLHRNEQAFPMPEEWIPDRWLENLPGETEKKERWFWAFGSGGRMCIGSNFAMNSNKFALAAIYSNFKTVIDDDDGIEQSDAYTAPPVGRRLILRFEEVGLGRGSEEAR